MKAMMEAGDITSSDRPMRVCYFGTYRREYNRNQMMIEGLRQNGVEVVECHEKLWKGIEDRVQATTGGWLKPVFWWRVLSTYTRLLRRYQKIGPYDVLVVGYPGQFDVFLARLLSWLRRKPLVWDILMSIYLVAIERDLEPRSPVTIKLIRWIEKIGLRLPDMLIQDTQEYVKWYERSYGIPAQRFRLVPIGADDRVFKPVETTDLPDPNHTLVVYYGTFIPNHGVTDIIKAARLLSDVADIHFELIGQGPERDRCMAMAEEYGLENITFIDWMDKDSLVKHVAQAQVCLGAFGNTTQSLMTVHNKIYEGLAMAKAVINGDSPAVRQTLENGVHLYLCERDNPQSLADAIRTLHENPELRQKLACNGRKVFSEQFKLVHTGRRYASHLREACTGRLR
jgi:glycosyltransferase involved in cell wall biosynthesis